MKENNRLELEHLILKILKNGVKTVLILTFSKSLIRIGFVFLVYKFLENFEELAEYIAVLYWPFMMYAMLDCLYAAFRTGRFSRMTTYLFL